MRSILLFIALAVVCLSGNANAPSPEISINHYLETQGEVIIPVYITNVNDVGAITFHIYYNIDALEYITYQNLAVTGGAVNDMVDEEANTAKILVSWFKNTPGTNINGIFMELVFMFSGDYSDFTFDEVEFADYNGATFPVDVSNGSITYQEPVEVAIGAVFNPPPGIVDIPLFVDFSVVAAGVGAFDFLIEYDHNVLSEPGFSNEEVSGIELTTPEPGQIRLQWENTSPPGSQLNGQLLNLNFQIIEDGSSGLSFIEDSSSIANQDGINLPVSFVDGFIGQDETPVPPTETLEDVIVHDDEIVCFNATQTIITAGGNTYFVVEGGGSATLIAGQTIRMLPGTVVEHGGYLHARITLDDEYCGAPVAKLLDEPADEPLAEQILPVNPGKDALFKAYPNPTTGAFTLELLDDAIADKLVTVEVYGIRGERIFTRDIHSMQQHVFTLDNHMPGIYIIRVTAGERTGHQRIIKR